MDEVLLEYDFTEDDVLFDEIENACYVCGLAIDDEDWDGRHECHEEDCLHQVHYEMWEMTGCCCDLQAHAECCTQCRGDDED